MATFNPNDKNKWQSVSAPSLGIISIRPAWKYSSLEERDADWERLRDVYQESAVAQGFWVDEEAMSFKSSDPKNTLVQ